MSCYEAARFWQALDESLRGGTFISLTLSRPVPGADVPERQRLRPVDLRRERRVQWAARRGAQETHENLSLIETVQRCTALMGAAYCHARLLTTQAEWELRVTRRGGMQAFQRLVSRPPPAAAHNRQPAYIIPEGTPCPFLSAIDVMTAEGKVRASKQSKFRQINRYLEFVRDVKDKLPADGRLEVVDCGCGKSGLTFALHHYLTQVCRREVHIVGLDLSAGVIRTSRRIAERLGLTGIEFHVGDIAGYSPPGPVHLVVSLHACDTATDEAIVQAIRWKTDVLFAVPCCHQELAGQLRCDDLAALLDHGILRQRLGADVTDALRAEYLSAAGYDAQVLQFIELEHTPKNLLIRAVRRKAPSIRAAWAREHYYRLRKLIGNPRFALDYLGDASVIGPPPSPSAEPSGGDDASGGERA